MNSMISIIVPVFNVSRYIDRCINSLVSQTYNDLEIILINDGSTDSSLKICNKWAEKDKRIKVIDKKNGGVSSARNVGLNVARGEYIGFIDPDDWVEPDMYKTMVEKLNKYDAAAVFCNFINRYPDHSKVEINRKEELCLDSTEALSYCLKSPKRGGGYFTSIWNKLFRRSIVFPYGTLIYFTEGLTVGEDELWLFKVFNAEFKVCLTSEAFYNYFQRDGGALSIRDQKKITKHSLDSVYAKECVYSFYKRNNRNDDVFDLTKERLFYYTYMIDKNIFKISTESLKKIFSDNYKIGKKAFYKSKNFSKLCKLKILVNRFLIKINAPEKLVGIIDSFSVG